LIASARGFVGDWDMTMGVKSEQALVSGNFSDMQDFGGAAYLISITLRIWMALTPFGACSPSRDRQGNDCGSVDESRILQFVQLHWFEYLCYGYWML
jgi:hypothetical protein